MHALWPCTVRPCLSDGISFLTFCWINEVAGLTNPGLEAGSCTHDAHVHMYIKMKHFEEHVHEQTILPAVKGKPACAGVNVHRLHLVELEIATFSAPLCTCVSTESELQSKVYVPATVCARK